jgi:hypothetical protein
MAVVAPFWIGLAVSGQAISGPRWQIETPDRALLETSDQARFVLDNSSPPMPDFKAVTDDPGYEALPDDPTPASYGAPSDEGTRLDLTPPDPQFHYGPPSNDVLNNFAPPQANSFQSGSNASNVGYTPSSFAQANSDFGNLSINGFDVGAA